MYPFSAVTVWECILYLMHDCIRGCYESNRHITISLLIGLAVFIVKTIVHSPLETGLIHLTAQADRKSVV